ncbi:MAG TPA: RAD55 family ATPase [Thermoplasmata archaeon]|nr:RAD55 family ATPase [Thermoplasmata archaeon]
MGDDTRVLGIPEIDDALWPALPPGWLALLAGHSGSGAPLLAKQFAHAGVGSVPVLFYTTFERTEDVTRAFEDFGWDPAEIKVVNLADEYYERVLVHGLDIARAREKGLSVEQLIASRSGAAESPKPFSLTSRMLSDLAEFDHPFRLVLDSVDFFLEVLEPHDVTTVARQIRHRCRTVGGQALLTAHSLAHDRAVYGLLHDLSDLVFELKSEPRAERFGHSIVVEKVGNRPDLTRIAPVHVSPTGWAVGPAERAAG